MDIIAELGQTIKENEAPLLRYAQRFLRDAEESRDIVQEAFIRLVKTARKDPEKAGQIANVTAWLYKTTRNLCIDLSRSKRRQMEITLDEDRDMAEFADGRASPDQEIARKDDMSLVRQQINQLDPRDREVVVLKMEHGKSYKEIAELMELSVGNVGFILHQAMKKIAAAVKELK